MRRLIAVFACVVGLLLPGAARGQASGAPLLYVANQGEATVSIIDMQSLEIVDRVDLKALGFSKNAKPHHVVAEADGSAWYLTLIGANTVLKFNAQNELVKRLDMEVPGLLAIDTTSTRLYAGRSMSAVNPPQSLAVIDRAAMRVEMANTFFPRPHPIAVSPDGRYVYNASLAMNQMLAMDASSTKIELKTLGGKTQTFVDFAVTPDGTTMVGTGQVTGEVLLFDMSNAPAITVTDTLQVGAQPWHPVISPDGRYAYIPNKASHSVSIIDLQAREVVDTITGNGLAQPHGTVLSADGRYLFVSNNNRKGTYTPTGNNSTAGTITVIDTQSREIVEVIEVGTYPSGIGTWGGQVAAQ
ncbi:YVTN family beta-propeller repeat protein [Salisaeta longa]|uniref:YVTN family beta-propeller repeat protein n=1 Tax=Salisaeta longa TaxID=503170 RepID=UPI001E5579EF|nr:beta-propeller fold lactonase family protein [Salisaeta longa]